MHQASQGRRRRRQHSPHYKAELVQLCLTGGASLASIAVDQYASGDVILNMRRQFKRIRVH